MEFEEHQQRSMPRPIDGGRVAQAIVEYTGVRLGAMTYRGPSGREYRFSATPSEHKQYVLSVDLEHFGCQADFRVLEEGRIDPEAERLRSLEEGATGRAIAEVERRLEEAKARQPQRAPRKSGGRPPVPLSELQEINHRRRHQDPPESLESLAKRFLPDDYYDPKGAISQRLQRFKKRDPELVGPQHCPYC